MTQIGREQEPKEKPVETLKQLLETKHSASAWLPQQNTTGCVVSPAGVCVLTVLKFGASDLETCPFQCGMACALMTSCM